MIITISREFASNGELIGRLVAERLGLRFLNREIIEDLARRLDVEPGVIDQFNESTPNPIESILMEWRSRINEETYAHALHEALARVRREDNAVIIGRGANFGIDCPECLHVRIIAPLALRIGIYLATHEVSEHDAERRIRKGDRDRANFVSRIYHQNINDARHYDLVLNLAGIIPEFAAEIIAHTAQLYAAQQIGVEERATLPQHVTIMSRRRPVHRPLPPGDEELPKSA